MSTNIAQALPEDKQAVLEIRSGQVKFDQKNHCGIFIDQVELDQGSTHVRAFKVITETNEKNALRKAIMIGNIDQPAHYWTLMSQDKPVLHAYADRIEYYPEDHIIKLIGQAHIEQGTNSFSATTITLNTETQKVQAKSQKDKRTLIIFHSEPHTPLFTKLDSPLQQTTVALKKPHSPSGTDS
jgi:lipopolysaccharide export system protein LptA